MGAAARRRLRGRRRGARVHPRRARSRASSASASCRRASPASCRTTTIAAEYILEYGVDALEMHADALADGARVLLHDDLLATGGTARALAELIEGTGAQIVGCAFLVELAFLRRPRAAGGLRRARAAHLRRRVIVTRSRTVAAAPEAVWKRGRRPARARALVAAGRAGEGRDAPKAGRPSCARRAARRCGPTGGSTGRSAGGGARGRRSSTARRSRRCWPSGASRRGSSPRESGTRVTLELRAAGARDGRGSAAFMLRRAARKELDGALDGLREACSREARAGLLGLGRAGRGAVAADARDGVPARRARCRRRRRATAGGARRRAAARAGARRRGAARRLVAIAGAVRDDREARVLRCRGKSYLDLLAQRAGECEDAPDAVVAPADHDQVLAVLQVVRRARRGGGAVRRRHERGRRAGAAARAVRGA